MSFSLSVLPNAGGGDPQPSGSANHSDFSSYAQGPPIQVQSSRAPTSGGGDCGYNEPTMSTRPVRRAAEYDVIEPIGKRVVVRKDDNKRQTKSGIVLPDTHEIPVITGRVIAISKAIENDDDQTIRQYDKVLFDPREAIPVELDHDNRLFVVHIDRVLAIFRRSSGPEKSGAKPANDDLSDDV
jgi:chaperonin GroES